VLVSIDEGVDHVGSGLELRVFISHVHPEERTVDGVVDVSHFLHFVRDQRGKVVVHFNRVLVSESDKLENLATGLASLEGAFSEHKEKTFVSLVIVFVGLAGACHVSGKGKALI
jgi:hypothetical protein